jgi:uncharacterized protein (TIGR03085 family)
MSRYALAERADLVEALRSTGPDAPTLCGGWNTNRLAAHLVLRERSLIELLGRAPSARLQAIAERHINSYVASHDYEQLVAQVEAGAPVFSPFALPPLREAVNLLEYLVHDEDVRRARVGWEPRAVPVDRQRAVWSHLRMAARMTLRSLAVPTQLTWPSHGSLTVGHGAVRVTVCGDPVELALLAFGRQRVAHLDYDGAADDVAVVHDAKISV